MLDEQTMMFLTQDPDIEISAVREYPIPGMAEQNLAQGIMTPPPMMYDVEIKRRIKSGKVKIEALHKEGKTNIYRFDGPKYIPGLL